MRIRRKTTKREHRWLLGAFCLIWATTPLALSAQDMRPLSLKESLEAAVKHERVVAAQSIAQAAQAEIRIADRAPARADDHRLARPGGSPPRVLGTPPDARKAPPERARNSFEKKKKHNGVGGVKEKTREMMPTRLIQSEQLHVERV